MNFLCREKNLDYATMKILILKTRTISICPPFIMRIYWLAWCRPTLYVLKMLWFLKITWNSPPFPFSSLLTAALSVWHRKLWGQQSSHFVFLCVFVICFYCSLSFDPCVHMNTLQRCFAGNVLEEKQTLPKIYRPFIVLSHPMKAEVTKTGYILLSGAVRKESIHHWYTISISIHLLNPAKSTIDQWPWGH